MNMDTPQTEDLGACSSPHVQRSRKRLSKLDIGVTYDLLEKEANGVVSPPILQKSLINLGLDVSPDDCEVIYNEVTDDGNCEFNESSFESWVQRNDPELDPNDVTHEAFRALDKDRDGYLTFDDLKAGLPPLGMNISDSMLRIMFDEADKDCDGRISYEDLIQILSNT